MSAVGTQRGDELRCCLRHAVERQRFVVVRLFAHDDGFPEPEAPLQAALEVGAARRPRHDLDAHDAAFARVVQKAPCLPSG